MLKWLVAGLGVALLVLGGGMAVQGWAIVQVERGWSQVISGSTILTGGCLLLAVAAAMARLDALIGRVDRIGRETFLTPPPPAVAEVPAPRFESPEAEAAPPLPPGPKRPITPVPAPALEPARSAPPEPDPVSSLPEEHPARVAPIRKFSRPAVAPYRRPPAAPAPAAEAPAEPLPFRIPARSAISKGPWPDIPEFDRTPELSAPIESIAPAETFDPQPDVARSSAMVRRYESGGVSYELYADGSIEAQTESGKYHFSSLADLKTFIESKK